MNNILGRVFLGHVSHTPESAYAVVKFSYQKCQKVRTQMIIPMSGAVPRPELAVCTSTFVIIYHTIYCIFYRIINLSSSACQRISWYAITFVFTTEDKSVFMSR